MPLPITSYAVACATGATTAAALDGIFAGQHGLAELKGVLVGQVPGELAPLPPALAAFDTRQGRLGYLVARQMSEAIDAAVARWGADRVGIIAGTSTGGIEWTEQAYERWSRGAADSLAGGLFQKHAFGAVTELIRDAFGPRGPAYTVSTACSSSAQILGAAGRLMRSGHVDAVLVIGIDTLCDLTVRGFGGLGLLSRERCRPFDAGRDGINIGEAGAALLLEREAEDAGFALRGFGTSSDGYHMTHPHPEGAGAIRAMREALLHARVQASDIAAINAHGTGTLENDRAEALAIGHVFGPDTPVVSTKGATGHTLGACGALEAIIALETLRRQINPGTCGLRERDAGLTISVGSAPVPIDGTLVASNSFAFGGNNATVILERA